MARKDIIWHRRKSYPVLWRKTIAGRNYAIVKKLSGVRERYMAFDRRAGPDGDMRAIHVFKRSKYVLKKLSLLKRVSAANRNTPVVLEYHPDKGKVCVVLTWVWGNDLEQYLNRIRKKETAFQTPDQVVRLVRGLAHGVSNLHHRQNIVHGDIKPANIILTLDPSDLVLIDFGSSWFVEETTKVRKTDGVSPLYAAPEQQRESEITADFRSDLFSLSVVLYEMLTLKIPYEGLGGAADSSMEDSLIPPSLLSPYPDRLTRPQWRELDDIVRRGLRISPSDRFPNRSEWLGRFDDLQYELRRQANMSAWRQGTARFAELPGRLLDQVRRWRQGSG